MKLTYLAHSSFLIECGAKKLLFDPWLRGPAYFKQWFQWPLPPKDWEKLQIDGILISHGHEDHLHIPTLKLLDKSAVVFFPFQWRAGIKPFLNLLGFSEIREAVTFKSYFLGEIKITYLGYSLESVIVVEYGGEVLVNINDALNSNHENATNYLLSKIKLRWPKIDYLLSGWSGASYFPNQVRYPGKNDREIGQLREQYFAHNFFRFTHFLEPRFSIPFAPGFVLLRNENRWINHIKFPREKSEQYYKDHFDPPAKVTFLISYPGDVIENGVLERRSELHGIESEMQYELAYRNYKNESEECNSIVNISEDQVVRLIKELTYWMNCNKVLYHERVLEDAEFGIQLTDVPEPSFLNVLWDGKRFSVSRKSVAASSNKLLIRTEGQKLLYALSKVWGGDVLSIGYGVTVDVFEESTLEKNLDIVCIRLITRYPMAREDLRKFPFRAVKFFASNPKLTALWIRQKVLLKPYVNRFPFNERDHWLTYNKCDLCAVCKMPEVNLLAYR